MAIFKQTIVTCQEKIIANAISESRESFMHINVCLDFIYETHTYIWLHRNV